MARASGFFGLLFLYDLKDILDAAIQGSNDLTKGRTVIANHPIFIIVVNCLILNPRHLCQRISGDPAFIQVAVQLQADYFRHCNHLLLVYILQWLFCYWQSSA